MRQRLLKKSCHKFYCLAFRLFILLFLFPLITFAQEDSLQITFNLTSIHHSTQFRDSSAAFPHPVLSAISVLDSENQYVHGLADKSHWLWPTDTTESGYIVDDIWDIIMEYHEEDPSIPENPDVKQMNPIYQVTEITEYSGIILSVALAMDYSWSMAPDAGKAKEAAIDFVNRIDENDRVAIIKFYSDVYVYQDFTSDKQLLIEAIDRPAPDRWGTPLYRAIYRSVTECSDETGRRAVVVYTDGWDNVGDYTVDEIINHANSYNVSIFTVGLGEYLQEEDLIRIAKETGGFYTPADHAEELSEIYKKIYQTIKSQYILAHSSTDRYTNGTWRIVDIKLQYNNTIGTGKGRYYVPLLLPSVSINKKVETDSIIITGMDTAYYAISGDTINYELLVQNQGSGIAYDVNVRDLLPDSVTLLDYDRIPEKVQSDSIFWNIYKINPNSSVRISYRVQLRPMMPMGITVLTNGVTITCDRDSILVDNQDQATFNALGLPDFNVTCFEPEAHLSPEYPSQLSALIRNIGNANADEMFRVGFYIETIDSDPIGIDTVYSLSVGDSQTVECIWDEPNTGAYRLLVMADMDNSISELIEINNIDTCDINVGIDSIIVQISSISYIKQLKGVQGQFPTPIVSAVNIVDQNLNPIHHLANLNQWLGVTDNCDLGIPVGNVWKNVKEYHRYNTTYPSDSDVQSSIQVIEVVDSELSITLVMDFAVTLNEMELGIINALESLVHRISSFNQGAVVGIQNGVGILQHFTPDGMQINNAIAQSFTNQSGMVYDGLYRGIELSKTQSGRSAVLAIVGEMNTNSYNTFNTLIDKAKTSGIPLYILGLKDHVDSDSLIQLCQKSGGYYHCFSDINGFIKGLRISKVLMQDYYGLIHTSSDTIQNNTWRTLDVTISAFKKEGRDIGYYRTPFGVVDLSIEKTGVGDSSVIAFGDTTWWVNPGDSIFYTIRVKNMGHWDVEDVTVQDILPDYLIPRSLCGDTIQWQIPNMQINETAIFTYQYRVDTLMPPWHAALINQANLIYESDEIEENNHSQDTIWATSMTFPDPEIFVSPEWIIPMDSIQVDVMSPVFVEDWDLRLFFEDGAWDTTYADDFIQSTELAPNLWTTVTPKFGETKNHTINISESVGVIFRTMDIWDIKKQDTAFFNIGVPDLTIDKQGIGDSLSVIEGDSIWYVNAGDSIWYTITIQNIGHWDLEDIMIEDILPDYLIPSSVCGDTLQWSVSTLQSGEGKSFSYRCRVDTLMPPWHVPLVNRAMLSCNQDTIDHNNTVQDTVWVMGLVTPYPQVRVSPSVIVPKDSVEIEIMSPIEVESWDLKILFQNGELITSYADDFIQSTELYPNVWETVTPKFGDTKMRTMEENERVGVILETEDMWGVIKADTVYFRIRSYNEFLLDDNVFKPSDGEDLGIRFRLSSNRKADIKVYDIAGHFVRNVESRFYEAGWNIVYWDGQNERGNSVGSGLYIVMISSGDMNEAKKVILIR